MAAQITTWIMEPRDPLIVRDGRPFGSAPGARAISLPFPFPSTIAGGIRARAGINEDGVFQYSPKEDEAALEHIKKLRVRGPLLVQLTADGGKITPESWLVPAPLDALLLPSNVSGSTRVQQLVPLQLPLGGETDLDQRALLCVGQQRNNDPGKPLKEPPAYWYWQQFQTWLHNPTELAGRELPLSQLGLHGPMYERRQHVSIEDDTEAAKDGMLFETSGLEFTAPGSGRKRFAEAQRLALAVVIDEQGYTMRPGLTRFGGERRLITWRRSSADLPGCPEALEQAIVDTGHCRLFLLTPACFDQGYQSRWLQEQARSYGMNITLKSIAIQRPKVVSGWDLAEERPKPSRRLAPAGTVLFLALDGKEDAIRQWIRSIWMQCISDNDLDRADGFGLAVLGTWSGEPVPMERSNRQ
ncbi:MAG TPA: type III-B CRISPR module-associated protein Cmr3 [Ktedonobacteraceae bacterium]|nr:type III-B CRISPR module-associated protein Cmr3 [Ktedonobacteraceae bacterium]